MTDAPTRICPHCHTQTTEPGKRCPHCRKKFKKRSTLATLMIVVLVFSVLAIGGCAVLLGGAATAVDKAAKDIQSESDAKAITLQQYNSVKPGTTRAAVEKALGEPVDSQETEIDTSSFDGAGASSSHDCIYYNKTGELLPAYQFCFDNDRLSSKSTY